MAQWSSHFIEANDLSIHYLRTGNDKPPVILLHGFYDNGLCWQRVAETLTSEYDVILPDTRYHGLTRTPPSATFTYQDLASDTIALIEALDLRQPILMGHSMGASNAAVVAAERPDLVRAIVLEDPAWFQTQKSSDPEQDKTEVQLWKAFLTHQKALSHEDRLEQAEFEQPNWTADDLGPWMDAQDQFDMAIFEHLPDGSQVPWRLTPWREIMARVTCPTLILTGENKRGAIINPAIANELIQANPHCQIVSIEGAGHSIRRDRFDAFTHAVTKFLREL